jgi:hypothetical protein
MSSYPTGYDSFTNPDDTDTLDTGIGHAALHGAVADAVEAVQAELGLSPSGSSTTVADRLAAIESGGGGGGGSLVLIDGASFSAVSSKSFDACFDSTYDDYLMMWRASFSTGANLMARLRASSTDETGSNYYYQQLSAASGSTYPGRTSGDSGVAIGGNPGGGGDTKVGDTKMYGPALADETIFTTLGLYGDTASGISVMSYAGSLNNTTAYDGITIYPSAGTMTGYCRIYGFAK